MLDFVTVVGLSLILIPAVRQYSSPLPPPCTAADNSLYLRTAPLKCSICLSWSIQLPFLLAVYLTWPLCTWFCFFSLPPFFLGWVFQKDCKFYRSNGKSGANPCCNWGNSPACNPHCSQIIFFLHCVLKKHCVTSVVRVFFFHAGCFSNTPNTIFIFTFIFFLVYEGYVNLTSFELHFEVFGITNKAGRRGFSESVEEPTVKLGICSGTGV